MKIVYILIGYVALPSRNSLDVFKRHDSYWYEKIATKGHEKITPDQLGICDGERIEQSYYAFFPLYPAIVGATMTIFSSSFDISAFFISLLISIGIPILFYEIVRSIYRKSELAFLSAILLIILPFNFYQSMFYSEGLFLVLLLSSLWCIQREQWLLMAFLTSLLVICRPNGIVTIPVLFIFSLEKNNMQFNFEWLRFSRIKQSPVLYFIFPVLAFIGYCFYLKIMTGDFIAFKTAQRGWCGEMTMPWIPFARIDTKRELFHFIYLTFFSFIALKNLRKFPVSLNLLCWITILLPIFASSITLPRFISLIFIFPIIFADNMLNIKTNYRLYVISGVAIMHIVTFYLWVINSELAY